MELECIQLDWYLDFEKNSSILKWWRLSVIWRLSLREEEYTANVIREEILDAFQVTEADEPPASVVDERTTE